MARDCLGYPIDPCGNPADISEKILGFIHKHRTPYGLLLEPGPLLEILSIKEARKHIRMLQKFVENFSEKEIKRHNEHEWSCWQDGCEYANKKARELARKADAEKMRRRINGEPEIIELHRAKPIAGYIYFIAGKEEGTGTFKIGKSKNFRQRKSWLDVKLPFPCEIIHIIKSDDYTACEDYFHNMFDAKRKNGEWFTLTASDIDMVKKTTTMNFCDQNNSITARTTSRGEDNELQRRQITA